MMKDATLSIYSSENLTTNINLSGLSFHRAVMLEIYSGDAIAARVVVPAGFISVSAPVRPAKGANTVRFHVPEGCAIRHERGEQPGLQML